MRQTKVLWCMTMKIVLHGKAEDVLAVVAAGQQEMEVVLEIPENKLLEIVKVAVTRGVEVRILPKEEKPATPQQVSRALAVETRRHTKRESEEPKSVPKVEPAEIFSEVEEETEELPVTISVPPTPKQRVVSAKEGEDIAEVIGSRRKRRVID